MMTTQAVFKVWCFGKDGKLVVGGVVVESMEQARRMAREWNKDPAPGMEIEIVANARIPSHGTMVSAIY